MKDRNAKKRQKAGTSQSNIKQNRNRKTMEDRLEIIADFIKHCSKDIPVKDAAIKAGMPISTIYRWHKKFSPHYKPLRRSIKSGLSIDEAIKILVDKNPRSKIELLEACFKFIVWLRWPNEGEEHQTLICSCVASYCIPKSKATYLAQLDTDYKNIILNNLSVDLLARISTVEGIDCPWFYMEKLQDRTYTSTDVLAVIVWYLLSNFDEKIAIDTKSKSHLGLKSIKREAKNLFVNKPSLNKAFFLLKKEPFKYKYDVSRTTFDKLWSSNASAAPFLFVQSYAPGAEWLLDPASKTFVDEIDQLLADLPSRRLFFAHSKWAVEALGSALDPRAKREVTFPQFPVELQAQPVTTPPLTILIQTKLKSYKSGSYQ